MGKAKESSEFKYLSRIAFWDWSDSGVIMAWHQDKREIFKLTKWETFVFHEADGCSTIDNIISLYPTMYSSKETIPDDYREKILEASVNLIFSINLVKQSNVRNDLPYYFDVPESKQDEKENLKSMKEDGLI